VASIKQLKANRENAKKSTGPKSKEGKAITSKNAIKHGILSNVTVLPVEEERVFQKFKRDMLLNMNQHVSSFYPKGRCY